MIKTLQFNMTARQLSENLKGEAVPYFSAFEVIESFLVAEVSSGERWLC